MVVKDQDNCKSNIMVCLLQKKITSVTPLKIISSTKRIVLPVGEVYQLHVVGGSGSYKYVYNSKND